MSILSDTEIFELVKSQQIIKPFIAHQETDAFKLRHMSLLPGRIDPVYAQQKLLSYGLSSYGYDVRVADRYYIYHNLNSSYIDPKAFDEDNYIVCQDKGHVFVPPNSFVLAETLEYIKVPRDCLVLVIGKSTYARCGLCIECTPLEPEWEGTITLELSNTTPLPIKVYSGEGIAQLLFFQANTTCLTSYADRKGKYQGQTGINPPQV